MLPRALLMFGTLLVAHRPKSGFCSQLQMPIIWTQVLLGSALS